MADAAEEEPVCPLPAIKEQCKIESCPSWMGQYTDCLKRVEQKGGGDCEPYYFDLLKCIDKCAIPKVGKMLK